MNGAGWLAAEESRDLRVQNVHHSHYNERTDTSREEECAPPAYLTKAILGGRALAGEPRNFDY